MSNYCDGCRYDPGVDCGVKVCPYTTLYWDFLARHRKHLAGNPRMRMQLRNIQFVNNTCVHAGVVWSHAQRPDPNGSHLMFYTNQAVTSGFEVKHNIFCNVTDWASR